MAESEGKEGPVIKIVSGGEKIGSENREIVRKAFARNELVRGLSVSKVTSINDHPSENTRMHLSELEHFALRSRELPEVLGQFMDNANKYFSRIAKEEGLVESLEDVELSVDFVPLQTWGMLNNLYGQRMTVEGGFVGGFWETFTNKIFVGIDTKSDEGILRAAMNTMHELRHRVGRRQIVLSDLGMDEHSVTAGNLEIEPAANAIQAGERYVLFEEIYVTGWAIKHLVDILPPELKSVYQKHQEKIDDAVSTPIPVEFVSFENGGIEPGGYHELYKAYLILNREIPDFDDLMAKVRAGEVGSRGELARKIIGKFGKEAMKNLSVTKKHGFVDFKAEELLKVKQKL